MLAILLSLSGPSMNRIATLCNVSVQAVLNWMCAFAYEHDENPRSDGSAVIVELDEMWPP